MLVKIIKIGNSKGIRIPTNILKECQMEENAILTVENKMIIVKACESVRKNWEQSFDDMHTQGDDKLLINDMLDSDNGDLKW